MAKSMKKVADVAVAIADSLAGHESDQDVVRIRIIEIEVPFQPLVRHLEQRFPNLGHKVDETSHRPTQLSHQ